MDQGYKHDVFVSYRRLGHFPRWVSDLFGYALKECLEVELGQPARVFIDTGGIDTGVDWPLALGDALARSRILMPLFSAGYAQSPWCLAEISHMRAREELVGIRRGDPGLILPATVHDGDRLPADLKRIQTNVTLTAFTSIQTRDSRNYEQLHEVVRKWAPEIATAVERAPPWDASWATLARKTFENALRPASRHRQLTVPSLGRLR